EGWFIADELEGPWANYHPNGKISRKYFMLNGQRNGVETFFDYTGKQLTDLRYDRGMLVGITEFDSEGKAYNTQQFEQGVGELTRRYPDGAVKETVPLKYGVYNGILKAYAPDKTLVETGNYVLGDIEGTYQHFYPNGTLYFEGNYKSGKRE